MKRNALIALAGILSAAITVLAQAPPASKPAAAGPTVDQILDKYVTALGGRAAIEKLTSRVTKGVFQAPEQGAEGTFESYAKAPNMTFSMVDVPGFGQIRQGFDGSTAWADNPQSGPRLLDGQELSSAARSAEFYQAIKLRALYPKLALKGKDKVGTQETYIVEGDPGDGTLRRMYFDTATGLMLRSDIERDGPQGRATFESYLDDYKEVDGVKLPFSIRQMNPNVNFTLKIREIRHNVPVEDSKVAKPSAP